MLLHDLVTVQAARTPHAVAVQEAGHGGQRALTYGQLDRRAECLAQRLRSLGVGPEILVALAFERSESAIIAMLAVLKAGGAYLPLDISDPAKLLTSALAQARPHLLLTVEAHRHLFSRADLPLVICEASSAGPPCGSKTQRHNPATRPIRPGHPAYVLYTSGSTGQPKAVVVTHRAIYNHQRWMQDALELGPDDRVLHKARLDFDASVWEIWAPLIAGARLVLAPPDVQRDPAGLVATLQRHRISILHVVPTLLGLLLDQVEFAHCVSLRKVCSGGEALERDLGARFFGDNRARCSLLNLYGPTETTIQATFAVFAGAEVTRTEAAADDEGFTLTIGRPIDNVSSHLLNQSFDPVEPGEDGVLYLGGEGLARGYLHRPAETARCFVPDPFAREPGERIYDTGDLARQMALGDLQFRGRVDHQLEIRGFRVEPAEIEAALRDHSSVREALVVTRDGPSGPVVGFGDRPHDPRLVAYAVAHSTSSEARSFEAGASEVVSQTEHVALWRSIYEKTYGQEATSEAALARDEDDGKNDDGDPASDFASWDSSYTGLPLPEEEMRDAVEQTVSRILDLRPRRALEVGCGTGLLMFRVAPHCASYLGTDFSPSVIKTVGRRRPKNLTQLHVRAQPADDFSGIEAGSVDTIVCNSVIGHFPSMDYLTRVLEKMVEATAEGGSIFIGDVRNLPLLEALMGSIELFKASAEVSLAELRRRIQRGVEQHNRLVVDPAFFTALKRRLPRICEVRILPKTGRFVTELTRFRYDAILHLDQGAVGLPPLAKPEADTTIWLDWQRDGLSSESLGRLLQRDRPVALGLKGVVNARLWGETRLLEGLADPNGGGTVATNCVATSCVEDLRKTLADQPTEGLDPDDLRALFSALGYHHELSWARCDSQGSFDVVLWSAGNGEARCRPAFPDPDNSRLGRAWSFYGSNPLRGQLGQRLIPRWREHLEGRLPDHMLPSAYVLLDTLPLTASGKLDRRALPPPGSSRPELETLFAAPRNRTEERLVAIWREVLGINEIGVHDNFFALGGHSLLATQVASRVRRLFQAPLPLRSLLEEPTVAELADRLTREHHGKAELPPPPPFARTRRTSRLPLSFAQQRLWFFDRLVPGNVIYNESALFDLTGTPRVAVLGESLLRVMLRHEILRTTFGNCEGEPFQVIHDEPELDFKQVDLSRLAAHPSTQLKASQSVVQQAVHQPFDLGHGPLLRVRLLSLEGRSAKPGPLGEQRHQLLFVFHHIISDGWSRQVLYGELATLYRGLSLRQSATLPQLTIQYVDFAAWQREWLRGDVLKRYVKAWRGKLGGEPPRLTLPYDRPLKANPTWRGATRSVRFAPSVFRALTAICQQSNATPFMGLTAALKALLLPWSRGRPIVVGTIIAGRNHQAIEDLLGFFINVLPLHTDVSGDPSFAELLERIRETVAFSDAMQDLPFDKLVEELQPRRVLGAMPLFQVLLNYQSEPPEQLDLEGLSTLAVTVPETTSKFELCLALDQSEEGLVGHWIYRSELFDAATIEALAVRFEHLLGKTVEDPRLPLSRLQVEAGARRRQVLEGPRLEGPRPEPRLNQSLVHERIREWAEQTPHALAVVVEDCCLTYGQLVTQAVDLAHNLRSLGVGPEVPVALALERSVEMMVAMLGVLEAGGVWSALDPSQPKRNQARLFAELRAPVLISDGTMDLPDHDTRVVHLDHPRRVSGGSAECSPDCGAMPENLAYIVFTSGSTGPPKAVCVEHRQLLSYVDGIQSRLKLGRGTTWANVSTLAADLGNTTIFGALCYGGCLHLIHRQRAIDPRGMADLMARQPFDCLKIVPSHLRALQPEIGPRRWLVVGGEALPRKWIENLRGNLGGCRVLNHYGPSETTIGVMAREVDDDVHAIHTIHADIMPLGGPLPGARIHLLTPAFEPAFTWMSGEILIGGSTVSRGYRERPRRTAESFAPDPFSPAPGERLYRSGDRGRWLADGDIEFLGRVDHQIKLHGFRVELSEIQQVLLTHGAIREGVVRLLEEEDDRALVAFYVSDEALDATDLRRWLARDLPEQILPHFFVHLRAFSLTANGKIDPRALPGLGQIRATRRSHFIAPRSPTEAAVAKVWSKALAIPRIGANDDFFELGGHSLLAARVAAGLSRASGFQVPLRWLFDFSVVADLARAIDKQAVSASTSMGLRIQHPVIQPLAADDVRRSQLSFAQRRLWFLHQLDGGTGGYYNVPAIFNLEGELRVADLINSLVQIVRRHEILRTTFPSREGHPRQRIDPAPAFDMILFDLRALENQRRWSEAFDRLREETLTPFDLARGPLLRIRLLRLGRRQHVMLLVLHHIVVDAGSRGVLYGELATLYAASGRGLVPALPELSVQYADFAAWQRKHLSGQVLDGRLEYWHRRLRSLPILHLPCDRPRGRSPSPLRGGDVQHLLDTSLTNALGELGRTVGASLYMVLLASFSVLLARLSGQRDFGVGSPFTHRGDPESERLIGCFVNLLVMRPDLSTPGAGFSETLRRVRDLALDAFAHQDLAFEKLVEELAPERDLSRHPLFQVTLALQGPPADLYLEGLTTSPVELDVTPVQLDLELYAQLRGEDPAIGLHCRFAHQTDLFDAVTVRRWADHFENLLRATVASPEKAIDDLAMHTPGQHQQVLVEWNDTSASLPAGEGLYDLFARQAARVPDRAAIVRTESGNDAVLSYAFTQGRARRIADVLSSLGAGGESRVALLLERGPELVLAMLGVLEAGAAYLPLDVNHPPARLAELIEDARVAAVVTVAKFVPRLASPGAPTVVLGPGGAPMAKRPVEPVALNLRPTASGAQVAYVLYTSGSTGRPKGVVISHAAITSHMRWMQKALPLDPDDRVLQKTPATFDASVWEFWAPLQVGAPVILAPPASHRDPSEILAVVRRQRIHVLQVVPSVLEVMLDEPRMTRCCTSLRRLLCGGEPLSSGLVRRFLARGPRTCIYNVYGPTEAAIHATLELCGQGRQKGVTLGRPILNVLVHVLDGQLWSSVIGATGELFVAGAGLARGYLDQPRISAESFMPNPFAGAGERLYRTGDQARLLADGRIEFHGRRDQQVKLRGVRFELGEVEATLASHHAVRRAVAVLTGRGLSEVRQTGFAAFVEGAGEPPTSAELRHFLKQRLPTALHPDVFIFQSDLPRLSNGKMDRRALERKAGDILRSDILRSTSADGPLSQQVFSPPRGPVEETLATIWSDVLGIPHVGVNDHFFELGGHSLLATQVISRTRRIFAVDASLRDFFERPILAHWAEHIDGELRGAAPIESLIEPSSRHPELPLSFAQQRLFFLDQLTPGAAAYNMPTAWRLQGLLDKPALAASCRELTRRHEVLRTCFPKIDGEAVQAITSEPRFSWTELDLQFLTPDDGENAVRRAVDQVSRGPFSLAQGPLFRVLLARLGPQTHVLLMVLHHIIADGWSWGILQRELSLLYSSFRKRRSSPFTALAIQYADFAVWQRRYLRGERLQAELAYWQRQLADLPTLDLPTDRPRPMGPLGRRGVQPLYFDAALTDQLRALSLASGTSLYMTLLAAYMALLSRYGGQWDLAIGSPIANRHRQDLEGVVGFFVNLLVLRGDLTPCSSGGFQTFLFQVRETSLAAYTHQDLPFEMLARELQPERELSRHVLVQATFALQNVPVRGLELDGLEVKPMACGTDTARCDLELHLWEESSGLTGSLIYAAELFEPSTMARLENSFERLLRSVADDGRQRLEEIPLNSPAQDHQLLVEWNDTQTRWPDEFLQGPFENTVVQVPDRLAVTWCHDDGEAAGLTFRHLDRLAHRLASLLRARRVGAESRVAIFFERGPGLIIAMLGIVKAGGAYMPIDPDSPPRRLELMLADSRAEMVLTSTALVARLPRLTVPIVHIGTIHIAATLLDDSSALEAVTDPDSANLAYVLYTSGSTGRPKGVAISHRSIAGHMRWMERDLSVQTEDRVLQKTSASFDASVWEFWAPLQTGACLVLARLDGHRDPAYLVDTLRRERITILQVVPTLLRELVSQPDFGNCFDLRRIVCGGEPLTPELRGDVLKRLSDIELANVYGPTEATIHASGVIYRGSVEPVTVGRPIANAAMHLLDHLCRSPLGARGELHIGGVGLARGYLARPETTAERFIPDPFATKSGARLYKTGDRARQLADGCFEFVGRLDHQVKIRGFRVELGEIEAALRQHEDIRAVVVSTLPASSADPGHRLVAHIVAHHSVWKLSSSAKKKYVERWQSMYENLYQDRTDFVGWNSSSTGEPLPREEMDEWLDRSVAWILEQQPQRVLELGCGTGLLLRHIAPRCQRYVGTDFSRQVLAGLKSRVTLPQVELVRAAADEFAELDEGAFDTVILNSIVQYFPDVDYLVQVLEGAVRAAAPGGSILVGDVRNLCLLDAFHAASQASSKTSHGTLSLARDELRQHLAQRRQREKELLIHPAFFEALRREIPRLSGVRIEPRQGRYANELTKFRYNVVLELDRPPSEVLDESLSWRSWRREALSLDALRRQLKRDRPEHLGLVEIPNGRLVDEGRWLSRLSARGGAESSCQAVDPDALRVLGRELGYTVQLDWGGGAADGAFDALLSLGTGRSSIPVWPGRIEPSRRAMGELVTHPLRTEISARLRRRWKSDLAEQLPPHMIPSIFVILDRLPLSASGKVNLRALPRPDARPEPGADLVQPRSRLEQRLAKIWSEILGVEQIGAGDDFFALGGHSLLAIRLVERLRQAFDTEISLRQVFETPILADLATVLPDVASLASDSLASDSLASDSLADLPSIPRDGELALSFAQQRLWFLQQLHPESTAYNLAWVHQIKGRLNKVALETALAEIRRRHEVLRTRYPSDAGRPRQQVEPVDNFRLPCVDLSGLASRASFFARRDLKLLARRPFDLARETPLRLVLVCLTLDQHLLFRGQHHIASDGWSTGIFQRELGALYRAFAVGEPSPLPELPVQYIDFAAWQQAWLRGEKLETQVAFWRQTLKGLETLELPTDRPRGTEVASRGVSRNLELSSSPSAAVQALARQSGTTLYMVLLAGWAVFLHRLTGLTDIAVGSPVANRRHPSLDALIGFFVNTLVLRVDMDDDPAFLDLLAKTRSTCIDAYAHQDVPFEKLVAELAPSRDLSRLPLAQVLLAVHNVAHEPLALKSCQVESWDVETVARYDLEMHLWATDERIEGVIIGRRDLFDGTTLSRWLSLFERIVTELCGHPETAVTGLGLSTATEHHQMVVEWNDHRRSAHQGGVHRLVEAQAAKNPDTIALVFEEQVLSYSTLLRRSARWAWHLRKLGVTPETRVAIAVERSPAMALAVLAVLRAGGAYVPMDPAHPPSRRATILADSGARLLIVDPGAESMARPDDEEAWPLWVEWPNFDGEIAQGTRLSCAASQLAYVLYTSGSTGRPKGISMSHGALSNLISWQLRQESVAYRIAHLAALTFDVSFQEMWTAWASGGTLILVSEEVRRDIGAVLDLLGRARVEVLFVPFVSLQMLAELARAQGVEPDALQQVITAGEALRVTPAVQAFFTTSKTSARRLINQYGPTETHVVSSWKLRRQSQAWETTPPIGRPVANLFLAVLDKGLQPPPLGVAGELCIGGAGLARGELARPGATAERFVPDALFAGQGRRLYRSADLARYRSNGALEFLGRLDHQLKVRGVRLEPGEIEATLVAHPAVVAAAVTVWNPAAAAGSPVARQLVAHVVGTAAIDVLRQWLTERLPPALIPTRWKFHHCLPLTASGKVDRHALGRSHPTDPGEKTRRLPRGPMQQLISKLWSDILDQPNISARDDFFALGGHSLQSAQVAARLSIALGTPVSVQLLFLHPILEDLARVLVSQKAAPDSTCGSKSSRSKTASNVQIGEADPPNIRTEPRDLSRLVLAGEIESVDAAAIGYLSPRLLARLGMRRRGRARAALDDLPYVSEIVQTPWGRIAVIVLPLFGLELYEDQALLLDKLGTAFELASRLGARCLSLTGLIPSATNYGQSIVEAMGYNGGLPPITTGHGTTCAAVGLNVQRLLEESGRNLAQERVAFLGLGSIGTASLRLLLNRLIHPGEIQLCDVATKRQAMERLVAEIRGLGFRGEIRLSEASRELPLELYDSSLIIGATNVPDVLDIERLRPGTLIVDDSGPHCFDVAHAERRLAGQGDFLFTEGGVLESPQSMARLWHTPPGLRDLVGNLAEKSPSGWRVRTANRITGCVFSSLLTTLSTNLTPTIGSVDASVASEHWDVLRKLDFRGASLHCVNRPLPSAVVRSFRARFGVC